MRRSAVMLLSTFAIALAGCASRQADSNADLASAPSPQGAPKLIVAIAVDQFSSDLFAEHRKHFSGGMARLLNGAVFPAGYQSHAATETCPGHSTLLTGVRPGRNGIVANSWFEPGGARGEKPIYCAEDPRDPASSPANPVVSAYHLKVPTLGELMKAADPASRNVAISAKDRAVVMMGGHAIDSAWWWKGGSFTSFGGVTPSPAVAATNDAVGKLIAKGAPELPVPAFCKQAYEAVPVGAGTVGTGRFALPAGKPDVLRISPRMDAATVDLAIALADEMNLGQGSAIDLLSVSLSATDYIGHATGTEGLEMCIQMAEVDRQIGRLLAHLDAQGIDYAVVLSADHGGLDLPERLDHQALPRAARVDPGLSAAALGSAISAKTGITPSKGALLISQSGDFYVNRSLSSAQRATVTQALLNMLRAHPQVAAAFSGDELKKTPLASTNPQDWTLRERVRASYDPDRSGDVLVVLDRAITPIPEPMVGAYVATHGSAWDYDRRVPILFWRKGMRGFEQPHPVETVDIAPTLAALIGLRVSDGTFDGRCLDLDAGSGNSCGANE